jgi:protein TonB
VSEQAKPGRSRKAAVIITVIVVVVALLAWAVSGLLGGKSEKARKPPKISLVAPPPPPPPPPPKFEKKPDPPKEQKEIKVDQQVPKQAPQPSPELKMEGPAGNGPSAFSSGKITSDDLSKIGTGVSGEKGGMLDPVVGYDNLTTAELKRYFRKNTALSHRYFTINILIWFGDGGELKRFKLLGSTGDSDTDEAIKQALSSLPGFSQKPPANMPQPSRLRINFSR